MRSAPLKTLLIQLERYGCHRHNPWHLESETQRSYGGRGIGKQSHLFRLDLEALLSRLTTGSR